LKKEVRDQKSEVSVNARGQRSEVRDQQQHGAKSQNQRSEIGDPRSAVIPEVGCRKSEVSKTEGQEKTRGQH
jgi:hypothetical protein